MTSNLSHIHFQDQCICWKISTVIQHQKVNAILFTRHKTRSTYTSHSFQKDIHRINVIYSTREKLHLIRHPYAVFKSEIMNIDNKFKSLPHPQSSQITPRIVSYSWHCGIYKRCLHLNEACSSEIALLHHQNLYS